MHIKQLKPAIEAILFLQHKPLPIARLAETIDETIPLEDYKAAVEELILDYQNLERGIELAEIAGGYLFRTKLEHRDMIRRMNQVAPVRMSQAMLEVLSILAFYQPVTREKLEDIRGVECGHHLRNLMEKKLVRMVGRSDDVGKPMLYGTTKEFLELFGLPSLKEMPTLQEIEDMLPKNEVGEAEDEEIRIRTELQTIVAGAKELEFSDIELEEQRLFGEAAAGNSKHDETNKEIDETAADGDRSTSGDDAAAPRREAGHAELQQDEVAGTIAFGQVSAAQEKEWKSDALPQPETADAKRERAELLADSDDFAAEIDDYAGEAPEDHLRRRSDEPTES